MLIFIIYSTYFTILRWTFKYFGASERPQESHKWYQVWHKWSFWNSISSIPTLPSPPCLPPKDLLWLTGLCVQNSSVPPNTEAIHSTWHSPNAASLLLSNHSLNSLLCPISNQVRDAEGEEKEARSPNQIWGTGCAKSHWENPPISREAKALWKQKNKFFVWH